MYKGQLYFILNFPWFMMDLFDLLLQIGLVTSAIVVYLIIVRGRRPTVKGLYVQPGWNFPLKLMSARFAIRKWKTKQRKFVANELPRTDLVDGFDSQTFYGAAPDGSTVFLRIRKLCGVQPLAEVTVCVKLQDGTVYLLQKHPDTLVGTWNNSGWNRGGLKIEVLKPLKSLRVVFNGMMTKIVTNTTHHVRLNLIFNSASIITYHPQDWSEDLAAQTVALEPWRDGQWPNMLDKWGDGEWHQWGAMQGYIEVGDKELVKTWLRIRGIRKRYWAPHGYLGLRRSMSLVLTAVDGNAVHLRIHSYRKALTHMVTGTIRLSASKLEPITYTDFDLAEFGEFRQLPSVYTFNVSCKIRNLRVTLKIESPKNHFFSGVPYQQLVDYRSIKGEINGEFAVGVLELGYEAKDIGEPQVRIPLPVSLRWLTVEEVDNVSYCANFNEDAASCPSLVGGKGASLALLASVQQDEGYIVPPGFCLTTHALEYHVKQNPELTLAIHDIENANLNYDEQNFKDKCQKAVTQFKNSKINEELREDILKHLNSLKEKYMNEPKYNNMRFAVRSSAIGEDSEALSAAGQNETVLGCVTETDVLDGVLHCWGSMFAFTSAHYRRQNGQPCWTGAGVVIQVMATPRAAGVLFTRHPQAGDPSRILITANYGLGESVVSGTVEPDTFIVKRDDADKLSILSIDLGSKTKLITSGENGVMTVDVPENIRNTPCLKAEEILQLARLAVAQEELWGAPRDIEWAIDQNTIYLLQARPITNLDRWTEEELLHELDSPVMSDDEMLTFANVAEVIPKPLSPITSDLVYIALQECSNDMARYNMQLFYLTHNRLTIGVYNLRGVGFPNNLAPFITDSPKLSFQYIRHPCNLGSASTSLMCSHGKGIYRFVQPKIDITLRISELSLYGHAVADERIHGIAFKRKLPVTYANGAKLLWLILKTSFRAKSLVKHCVKFVANLTTDKLETENILKLLEAVEKSQNDIVKLAYLHSLASMCSTMGQLISTGVLLEGSKELNADISSDMGILLGCADTVSADVPAYLASIARELAASPNIEEFRSLEPSEGMIWLRKNLPHIHVDLLHFLDKHGHRCLLEFDLSAKPWSIAPEGLIKVLQAMKNPNNVVQKPKCDKEVIASLTSPTKSTTRYVLRWMLPLCRRLVATREATKSQTILGIHKTRLALRKLATLMVKEWMLPDPELVFYFTLYELRHFIEMRDPALLRKAIQRKQYYAKWEKLKFPENCEGWPQPIVQNTSQGQSTDISITATTVCAGVVVGRACVLKDFSEIDQLQQGDILVTYSTDIGWSPYFPMLSGIVTELGGIISHGAVIARECGLPCIVGAVGATDIFSTGDLVRLNGGAGLLEKLVENTPTPEQQDRIIHENTL